MYFQVLDIESTQVPRYLGACTKFYAFKYMRVLIHAGYMRRNFHGRMDTKLVWHLLMKVLRYNPGTGIIARDPKNPIWYRGTCTPRLDLDRVSISSVWVYQVPGTWYQVPGSTWYMVRGTRYAYDGRAWTARSGLRPYRFLKTSLLHRLRPRLTAGYLALGRWGLCSYYHITSTYLRLCDGREFVLSESTKKFKIEY